jgi:hypothetical protein
VDPVVCRRVAGAGATIGAVAAEGDLTKGTAGAKESSGRGGVMDRGSGRGMGGGS